MRTEPPFNLNEPFPNPKELKPIRETEKMKQPDLRDGKEDLPEKGKKREKKEKKDLPKNDTTGDLGNKIDVIG
jgi:hypothetical protein